MSKERDELMERAKRAQAESESPGINDDPMLPYRMEYSAIKEQEAAAKNAPAKNWTSEFPTTPGYYWIRNYAFKADPEGVTVEPDIVSVERVYYGAGDYGPVAYFQFTGNSHPCKRDELLQAEWYGPIEPPE